MEVWGWLDRIGGPMRELKNYMEMTDEQLATEVVGTGRLNYFELFKVLFPDKISVMTPVDVSRLEGICSRRFLHDEVDSYEEELLKVLYGVNSCSMAEIESVADYLFTTPFDVMKMDLGRVYDTLRAEYAREFCDMEE